MFTIPEPVEQRLLSHAWPTCAVCGTPVEKMTADRVVDRHEVIFTAHCHGATETASISYTVLERAGLRPGVAFAEQPALSEGDRC